jgi:hypothetical protein
MRAVWASLRALKASPQWPAVLARAAPMTPAQGADEDGTRGPMNRPKGNNSRGGEEVSSSRDTSCWAFCF